MNRRYFTIPNAKIGACLRVVTGAETRLDLTPLAADNNGFEVRYPMTIELNPRGKDVYLRQGNSTVALDGTADQNYLLPTGATYELTVEGNSDGFIAIETTDLAAGTLIACRIDQAG